MRGVGSQPVIQQIESRVLAFSTWSHSVWWEIARSWHCILGKDSGGIYSVLASDGMETFGQSGEESCQNIEGSLCSLPLREQQQMGENDARFSAIALYALNPTGPLWDMSYSFTLPSPSPHYPWSWPASIHIWIYPQGLQDDLSPNSP